MSAYFRDGDRVTVYVPAHFSGDACVYVRKCLESTFPDGVGVRVFRETPDGRHEDDVKISDARLGN